MDGQVPEDPLLPPVDPDEEPWDDMIERSAPAVRRYGGLSIALATLAVLAFGTAVVLMLRGPDSDPAPARAATESDGQSVVAFRHNAGRICSGALRVDELFNPEDGQQLAAALELSLSTSVEPVVDQLADLEPPAEFTGPHTLAVETGREQIRVINGLVKQLRDGDDPQSAAIAAAGRLDELQARSNAAFTAMGVHECVAPPGNAASEESNTE